MFRKRLACGFLLVVAISALSLAAQQSSPAQPASPAKSSTLNVTVTDQNHHSVSGLKAENFKLFIDNQPQPISTVSSSDASTCMGLLIDTSGSMRPTHGQVVVMMSSLIGAANPQGQTFIVNFNDEPFLDQDFANDFSLLQRGLNRGDPRGGTALYDALIAASDHISGAPQCKKRALVLVSDGKDNESNATLEYAIKSIQQPNSPVVYAIVLPEEQPSARARKAMETLVNAMGGAAFFPGSIREMIKTVDKISEEFRNLYTLDYAVPHDDHDGSLHKIRVEAQSPDSPLFVRNQWAYYSQTSSRPAAKVPEAPKPASAPAPAPTARTPAATQLPNYFNCVTGRVVDENNLPLEGMTVRATPDNDDAQPSNSSTAKSVFARTGHNGTFSFIHIPPGSYRLSAFNMGAGYPSPAIPLYGGSERTQQVSVSAAQGCSDVVLNAGPKAARLRLKVVESGTGNPVTTFSVILRREDIPTSPITIHGDPEHDLLLPPLAEVTIQVQASGYSRSDAHVVKSGPSDSSQELTVELRPAFPRL